MIITRAHFRHTLMIMILGLSGILLFQVSESNERLARAEIPPSFELLKEYARGDLSVDSVKNTLKRRDELLAQSIAANFVSEDGSVLSTWNIELSDHPQWISLSRDTNGTVTINRDRLKQYFISYPPVGIPEAKQCSVLSTNEDKNGIRRVKTDCIAQSGYRYDTSHIASLIAGALESGELSIALKLEFVPALIFDEEHSPNIPLTLLSTGRSNFKGSALGRKANVRKAINVHQHNILIPPDAVFAFNATLGNVTVGNGWHMALTIFEGVNLRPAPGGGICQASTTVYRAALNAGLPIVEQKNHSLYVTYYEPHGVGLDATIFPGLQDLKYKNDTGGPIIVQSYTEGDDAIVNIFGYDDKRTVTLSGPYFASTAPEDLLVNGKKVSSNQIVWLRNVKNETENAKTVITARYNAIPRSLSKKWESKTVITRGDTEDSLKKDSILAER